MITLPFAITRKRSPRLKPESDLQQPGESSVATVVNRAWTLMLQGADAPALTMLEPLLRHDPPPEKALLLALNALLRLGRLVEAAGWVRAHLPCQLQSAEGFMLAGIVAARLGEVAMAADCFERAEKLLSPEQSRILLSLGCDGKPDLVEMEEILSRNDRDQALALACALGLAGHFLAAERFILTICDPTGSTPEDKSTP